MKSQSIIILCCIVSIYSQTTTITAPSDSEEDPCASLNFTADATTASDDCPAGWKWFVGKCYKIHHELPNGTTFDEAEEACQADGAHLASVHDFCGDAENRFITGKRTEQPR